jgi:hypothetical protein
VVVLSRLLLHALAADAGNAVAAVVATDQLSVAIAACRACCRSAAFYISTNVVHISKHSNLVPALVAVAAVG